MTHSYRKTPIKGNTKSESDKWFKRVSNKKARAKVRELLSHAEYDLLQVYSPKYDWWSSPKDGKRYFGDLEDEEYIEKLMRK